MANKDLFKQAIAEAKSVREAAIANAKEALEETLTPHLKDMLAAKLQEMEDASVEEEVVNEIEEEVEETVAEELSGLEAVAEAEEEEAEDDSEKSEDEAEEEAGEEEGEEEEVEVEDDQELGDLSVEDFKNLIRDIIAQEMGAGEAEPEMGADMDAGAIEEPAADDLGAEPEMGAEDEEEIDLDELLRELEGVTEEEVSEMSHDEEEMDEAQISEAGESLEAILAALGAAGALVGSAEGIAAAARAGKLGDTLKNIMSSPRHDSEKPGFAVESDLAEAMETIETLKAQLSEVNLLNAKLLYVNKVFKANNLTESQKVNIIAAFDKAETVKEVKLVFETVSESVVVKKETATIKENKLGMASKATGTTASKPEVINEVSDAVRRMQKLAGII